MLELHKLDWHSMLLGVASACRNSRNVGMGEFSSCHQLEAMICTRSLYMARINLGLVHAIWLAYGCS